MQDEKWVEDEHVSGTTLQGRWLLLCSLGRDEASLMSVGIVSDARGLKCIGATDCWALEGRFSVESLARSILKMHLASLF